MTQIWHNRLVFASRKMCKCLKELARPERFELPTTWFVVGLLVHN